MNLTDRHWQFGGATVLVIVSALIFTTGVMTPLVPMPIYLVLLAWIVSALFLAATPLVYLLFLKLTRRSKRFPIYVLALVLVLSFLNAQYFYNSWSFGVQYQGVAHIHIVASENLVGFGVAIFLSVIALNRRSQGLAHLACLITFVLLSWCAFPYLGEMP